MSKGETLRAFVNERLTAAADEIFALVEKTIAEYELELCRSKEENQRKQQLLDEALAPSRSTEGQQANTDSTDVQIQTETGSEVLVLGQTPGVPFILIKSENEDTDNEEHSDPMDSVTEVCCPETPPETNVINSANTRSRVGLSNQEKTRKTPSVGKRKSARPRRVVATAQAEKQQPQPSRQPKEKRVEPKQPKEKRVEPKQLKEKRVEPKQPKEKRVEPKKIERQAAKTRLPQKTQSQTAVERSGSKKGLEKTPVQSKSPKLKRPKLKHQKPTRGYRRNVEESLSGFISEKNTAEGSFRCSCCDKVFTRLHHLERHVMVHTGEKPFPCTECDKAFRLKQHLVSHMVVHRDERLFGCPVCDKKFKRRDNLGRHIDVHSGFRPFGCPQCDVTFTLKKNLVRHMKVHTRDEIYICPVCQMKFSSPFYYNKHVKAHL